jgi:phosphomannomutase
MNDGDGDRFVGGGRSAVLVMNKFGAMVVRHLAKARGVRGDVTRSVMTSAMAEAALATYLPGGVLHETPVGFQYMKELIGRSVNSWEESDGMSPKGWSKDKDGMLAGLLLCDMVLESGKTPEELLAATEAECGEFVFERRKVSGNKLGDALVKAIADRFGKALPGDTLTMGGVAGKVARVTTIDGVKTVFEDGAWFGVRASGTEPVTRPYVEVPLRPGWTDAEKASGRERHATIMAWLCAELASVTS